MGAIFDLIGLLLRIFQFILLARILLSWFPNFDRSNPIVRIIYDITEPVLQPIRNMLPRNSMGMDFSPMVVVLIIWVLQTFLRL